MTSGWRGPDPIVVDRWAPFWSAATRHRLVVQRCQSCGWKQFPALGNCTSCLGEDLDWLEVSGRGEVFSFVVYHQAWVKEYIDAVPYSVAVVALAEGPKIVSHVRVDSLADLAVGLAVEVGFSESASGQAVPHFTLVDSHETTRQ